MERIGKFYKVSREQFVKDWADTFGEQEREAADQIYDTISLPKRATSGSAGYDFYLPLAICLKPGDSVKVPTGIRVRINEGWVLQIYPRSGLGFKFRLQLNNTVGVIDSDYFNSDNDRGFKQGDCLCAGNLFPVWDYGRRRLRHRPERRSGKHR